MPPECRGSKWPMLDSKLFVFRGYATGMQGVKVANVGQQIICFTRLCHRNAGGQSGQCWTANYFPQISYIWGTSITADLSKLHKFVYSKTSFHEGLLIQFNKKWQKRCFFPNNLPKCPLKFTLSKKWKTIFFRIPLCICHKNTIFLLFFIILTPFTTRKS